ncbi:MAG: hypothetical protein ACLFV7_12360 [Phycisphaerae bacterium]
MSKRMLCAASCLLVAAAMLLTPAPAGAADKTTQVAREVFKKHQDSVLWVEAVLNIQASAGGVKLPVPSERKVRLLGTVIDDKGLMVVSNTRLDPASALEGRSVALQRGGPRQKVTAKSEVTELNIRMPDGEEVPGKVLLTDPDLDLAFIRIDTESKEFKGQTLKPVKLAKVPSAEVADELITISRLGKIVNYASMLKTSAVVAVVSKPRTFFIADGVRIGCPAFTTDGKLLGVTVFRRSPKSSDDNDSIPVVLPAGDIEDIARQAREVKPREPKKDAPDESADDDSKDAADDRIGEDPEAADDESADEGLEDAADDVVEDVIEDSAD